VISSGPNLAGIAALPKAVTHPEARLTDAEKQELIEGLLNSQ